MTTYNKLKIAILTVIASQNLYAINVDPAVIQSTAGELLYAEINFRQSSPNSRLEVGLAQPDDLASIRASHQPPPNLNFFTRYNSDGSGVITITSSRPMTTPELNFVVKVKDGSTTRLQHIKTTLRPSQSAQNFATANEKALTPIMIVNEKDIALNLPVSSKLSAPPPMGPPDTTPVAIEPKTVTQPEITQNIPSAVVIQTVQTPVAVEPHQVTLAPELQAQKAESVTQAKAQVATPVNPTPVANITPIQPQVAPLVAQSAVSADPLVKKFAETQQNPAELTKKVSDNQATKPDAPKTETKTSNTNAVQNNQTTTQAHVVRNNESLWTIASRIATQENRSVSEVMQQIKANNEHAFIKGDVNRLKRGATLNLNESGKKKEERKIAHNGTNSTNSKQTNKTKYRLNQAEMSLVTDSEQNSANGTSSKSKNGQQTSKELSSKVMTSREKTVKLQKNVTQLEVALNQKDHRIQLLNARLAQLQQQLKDQQAKKSNH